MNELGFRVIMSYPHIVTNMVIPSAVLLSCGPHPDYDHSRILLKGITITVLQSNHWYNGSTNVV